MGCGRGRGWPHLVPPSTTNPMVTDQNNADKENYGIDEVQAANLECNNQAGEEAATTDTKTLNQVITEEAKKEVEVTQPKKLWVDIINENHNPAKGLTMEFVAPKIVDGEVEIQIEEADVEAEVKFLESSLIMYALGVDLSMNAVTQFMSKTWNFVTLPEMFYNEEGFFVLRFHSFHDKELVLMKGSYSIRNRPMCCTLKFDQPVPAPDLRFGSFLHSHSRTACITCLIIQMMSDLQPGFHL
ncbi:unnamed protein product [Lathyrus sativus]|nr:unnamed protein product [Lathyrus sativus]